MKYTLTLLVLALTFNCGKNEEKDPEKTWVDVENRIASYEQQIYKVQDSFGYVGTRCDSATFSSLLSAFSNVTIDFQLIEKQPGKWVRHPSPCYPDHSKSETSLDVYLMQLHRLLSSSDKAGALRDIKEIIDYGTSNYWVMGEGAEELTNISALVPLIYKLESKLEGESLKLTGFDEDPILKGHKPHITAFFTLLNTRINGYALDIELALFDVLAIDSPRNPYFEAMRLRYRDGNLDKLRDILLNDFGDDLPLETNCYTWGSNPCAVTAIASYGIAMRRGG